MEKKIESIGTVIIGGVSRAGKSRLANLVFQQTRCTVVHLDSFLNAVRNNYPAPILTPREKEIFQDYCDTVLVKAIRNMGKEFNYLRVYESSFISPKLIIERLWYIKPVTLFLGYTNTEPERKLHEIRKAAVDDPCCWSHQIEDLELLETVKSFISLSQAIEKDCIRYGFPFFDVSDNWHDTVELALIHILTCIDTQNSSQYG
ncbi:hypothetical protein [Okeania sp. KiyG1]|uniref:hypothetical protein n=1 Tax=Okeania sp. KiyG1 TaxID=2720165 RepID=UPI0019237864|nr:hypothetical protein [Okeania sp. KiyG1]GGA59215.1 hypothetical protein CYANOKiyG1_80670 [Okeania sp. KiyG1]